MYGNMKLLSLCFFLIFGLLIEDIVCSQNDTIKEGTHVEEEEYEDPGNYIDCTESNNCRYTFLCKCDSLCKDFNDCCPEVYQENNTFVPTNQTLSPPGNLYACDERQKLVVSKCPELWNNDNQTKELCENNDLLYEIPFLDAPLTIKDNTVTYKNKYCALCNGVEEVDNQVVWNVTFRCHNMGIDYLLNNFTVAIKDYFVYNYNDQVWGIWGEDLEFHRCYISVFQPQSLFLRECSGPHISDCKFSNTRKESLCLSYGLAPVGDRNYVSYRNKYCAFCNGIDPEDLICLYKKQYAWSWVKSFGTLADFRSYLQKSRRCGDSEAQFGDKCKSLRCAKNTIAKGGRCVNL